MLAKIFLPTIFIVLAYGFWVSPNFKEISAGVAIFLFGMISLENGFRAFTGGLLENLLRRTTDKYWKSLSFGIITTSLMQSSSLVSLITISFLSAGLITLAGGIGVIFGANLGTTTGAWLVATFGLKVNIAAYAMPMIVFGVVLVFQKSKGLKGAGYVLAGLGFLFLGIHHMKEGFEAFRGDIDLTAFAVSGYLGVILFALLGMAATVIMQSSHATLVLIITALAAQQITYENGLALAIGANVGTTITAIIGALGSNVEGRRLAGAHLIFNLTTATIAIAFIYQLTDLVDLISDWMGISADNFTLKLAVFHTVFNTLGVVIMTPFMGKMVRFLEDFIKPKIRKTAQPRYLHGASYEFAETSIEAVRKEALHLFDNAFTVIARGLRLHPERFFEKDTRSELIAIGKLPVATDVPDLYRQDVKDLYSEIIGYISQAQTRMTPEQTNEIYALRTACQDIVEAIKGVAHLQKNLNRYLVSPNESIRKQYRKLRVQLAAVLHTLVTAREQGNDSVILLSLDELKIDVRNNHEQLTSKVDTLIRDHKITIKMATSLINDNNYASLVANKLIQAGEILFSTSASSTRSAERSIALEDHEIGELLTDTVPENQQ